MLCLLQTLSTCHCLTIHTSVRGAWNGSDWNLHRSSPPSSFQHDGLFSGVSVSGWRRNLANKGNRCEDRGSVCPRITTLSGMSIAGAIATMMAETIGAHLCSQVFVWLLVTRLYMLVICL
ncbi:hypothetical protein V1522DRAFT_412784 [Lipomyces starkeyi]